MTTNSDRPHGRWDLHERGRRPHVRPCGGDGCHRWWNVEKGPEEKYEGAERGSWSMECAWGGLPLGRRLGTRDGAIEDWCWGGSIVCHGKLLEEKLIPHRMEGGEGHAPLDESLQVIVAGAEATQEVQHQGAVYHRLAKIAEGFRQALHLVVVLPHSEVPLGELVELGVDVKSWSVSVPEELFLEGKPRLTDRVRLVTDDVLELDGDSSVEPGEHHGVHQGPC
jgi:hypothetical protein